MADAQVTRDSVQELARLIGLDLSDEKVDELLPGLRRGADGVSGLDALGLDGVEPAVSFKADSP